MNTEYSMEEFIIAAGFTLTPWQKELIEKIESIPPAERSVMLARPRRSRKLPNNYSSLFAS